MKCPYRIVLLSNGKQRESVGSYHNISSALNALKTLSNESHKNVAFPVKYINNSKLEEVKYELLLIKKRDKKDPTVGKVRNEYGEYVDHVTDNEMWLIIDKADYQLEEKFWVYGYHPLTDRKTFEFIYDNLVLPKATEKSEFLNIKLFLNKVLLISNSATDFITCKNKRDALRLYNVIQEKLVKNKKVKYVCFSGDCNSTKVSREKCISELMELTNWNRKKVTRDSTKP